MVAQLAGTTMEATVGVCAVADLLRLLLRPLLLLRLAQLDSGVPQQGISRLLTALLS